MADSNVIVKMMTVGPIGTNCYMVHLKDRKDCVVIDPGASGDRIAGKLREDGLSLDAILLTHGHFDHFDGVPALTAELGGRVYILDKEIELISDPLKNGSSGLMGHPTAYTPKYTVTDGEVLTAGGMEFTVIHTPGHTYGGCSYYLKEHGLLFVGDTIFMESVGRTDLPTGNMNELITSVREKILTLPDDTSILPGHGPVTDVGYESANNPYA